MHLLHNTVDFDRTFFVFSNIQYSTPFFVGKHHFIDKQLAKILVNISTFSQSEYWLDDNLNDDEQDQKLNELQQQLELTDDELSTYFYKSQNKWRIQLMPQNECFEGLPIIDEQFIEWR